MLRGVNRRIIEVNDVESPFFERAILFVKPECGEASEKQLRAKAADWLSAASAPPVRARKRKRRISRRALWLMVWLSLAASAAWGILYFARG